MYPKTLFTVVRECTYIHFRNLFPGKNREKTFTKETANALSHTFRGIVDMVKDFLSQKEFDYILLGKFNSDPLELAFSKLRHGAGSGIYLTVQQVSKVL